jgi:four helix bundle protein
VEVSYRKKRDPARYGWAPTGSLTSRMALVRTHEDLIVFQNSIDVAVEVFHLCKQLPAAERHLMIDQWLRCSRSVPANLAEAWRKRYYKPHFLSKLSDAEAEAAECQVWALLAYKYGYLDESTSKNIRARYDEILAQIVVMARDADQWVFKRKK